VQGDKVASGGNDRLALSRPFNITTESLTLRHFTRNEVAALFAQPAAESEYPRCVSMAAAARALPCEDHLFFKATAEQP
jgi:hypothetical protein